MQTLDLYRRILRSLDHMRTDWQVLTEDLDIAECQHSPLPIIERLGRDLQKLHTWAERETCRAEFGHDEAAFYRHAAVSKRCIGIIQTHLKMLVGAPNPNPSHRGKDYLIQKEPS